VGLQTVCISSTKDVFINYCLVLGLKVETISTITPVLLLLARPVSALLTPLGLVIIHRVYIKKN